MHKCPDNGTEKSKHCSIFTNKRLTLFSWFQQVGSNDITRISDWAFFDSDDDACSCGCRGYGFLYFNDEDCDCDVSAYDSHSDVSSDQESLRTRKLKSFRGIRLNMKVLCENNFSVFAIITYTGKSRC